MVHNTEIATIFEEIADLLELEAANRFRVRAYRNAARTVRDWPKEVATMIEAGEDLLEIPGIGEDLATKMKEIVKTGMSPFLKQLKQKTPVALTELLAIPGLGPKHVKTLYEKLHIKTIRQLKAAAAAGKIQSIPSFGKKTQARILQGIADRQTVSHRHRLADITRIAEALRAYLADIPHVRKVELCGSYRRGSETVGDLDIVMTATDEERTMATVFKYPEISHVIAQGKTKASFILRSKLQVDIRLVAPSSHGAAVHYFTGSKDHVIALRDRALTKGLKINEYGVFKGKRKIAGQNEEAIYKTVGLSLIPPELRENRDELEAAAKGALPKRLVVLEDLRGDLHTHTNRTDGRNTIAEMAQAAKKAQLDYLAITDHSKRLTMAHGLDTKALRSHIETLEKTARHLRGITLLKGIEVDILEDGELDLPDEVLQELDLVVGSVHSFFNLTREKQTERIIRAMNHKYFSILGHPSGRLLTRRQPYDVDMEQVIKAAAERGCYLELNANPERLDLDDAYGKIAKELGVLVSINSDAHSTSEFAHLKYGVIQARRGWLETSDIVNSRPLTEVKKLLAATMG